MGMAMTKHHGPIILHAEHMVWNPTSPHSLMSSYEMREAGIIVDDVSQNHDINTEGTKGTQTITFRKQGYEIGLVVKGALMTFEMMDPPTDEDIAKYPIVKISDPNWNPDKHHDDFNAMHTNAFKCVDKEQTFAHITECIIIWCATGLPACTIFHIVEEGDVLKKMTFHPYLR